MSDSNIGARKGKSVRNHIFILNGIINEALHTKNKAIDIQILDYAQCFDSLSLSECTNDLYDNGLVTDNLNMIFKMNENNKVAIKTPYGMTTREEVNKIVLQGEVMGPLQCFVLVDSFGKECLLRDKYL